VNGRPTERAIYIQTGFKDDGRRPGSTTVDLNSSATDVDKPSVDRKILRGRMAASSFVSSANDYDKCDDADNGEPDTSNPFHGGSLPPYLALAIAFSC
jgi:hypothetical protein